MAESRREVLKFQDIHELSSHFAAKVSGIRIGLELRGNDSSCRNVFSEINKDVFELKLMLKQMRSAVEKGKEDLKKAEDLKCKIFETKLRADYCKQHLPAHIPKPQSTNAESLYARTPMKALPSAYDGKENQEPKEENRVAHIGRKPKDGNPEVPILRYITIEEYNSIPKYIKGRVPYNAMNAAVDDFNKTILAKYKLLSKPRAVVGHHDMKRYKEFKSQETKDTSGLYFCVCEDLKQYSNFKVDNAGKSILISLRHCGLLREIRGPGNLIRYCIIT